LDESELFKLEDIPKYQSMIGACQWAVTCSRFDIMTAVMNMSHFHIAPQIGHMEIMKRIYGYLKRFKVGASIIKVKPPDLSHYPMVEHNWLHLVYGNVWELIPPKAQIHLEKQWY
jgi:hypothetical protein